MTSFPTELTALRVALVHDWLTGMRGGERVLEILCRNFEKAPIFSLIHKPASISPLINAHPVSTSWLQTIPGISKRYRYFLPFFPWTMEHTQLPPSDLVISTSHCVAKGVIPPPNTRHLCYCFTPMRYAWLFYEDYFGTNPIKKTLLQPVLGKLRDWDRRASDRVHRFVAISRHIQDRIRRFYDRPADVVYPPADTDHFTPGPGGHENFDLIVSALVPYKRIDLAVQAYNQLGYRLVIVGTGTEYEGLKKMARPNIEFAGWQSDESILGYYRRCRCLVFPGEEDFGIVPVEAQACGKPVVAFARGGALETVQAGVSGTFFDQAEAPSLLAAVEQCAGTQWDPAAIRRHAEQFGVGPFIRGLTESIQKCLKGVDG